jgi:predicted Zn-ribbon and HTH transcriptional regulator
MGNELPIVYCQRVFRDGSHCGYAWSPRGEQPRKCPKCMSYKWNEPPSETTGA